MSAQWDDYRRRYRLVQEVLDDVAATGRPVPAPRRQLQIRGEYGELGAFLRDVHLRWYRAFDARLDAVLESGEPVAEGLAQAWRELARELWPVRAVLDAYADHPALTEVEAGQRTRLLAATGVDLAGLATDPEPAPQPRGCPLLRAYRHAARRRPVPASA